MLPGASMVMARVTSAVVSESLMMVERTLTVASELLRSGVVTKVPQGTMWVSPVVMRRTWRLMPEPGYQREAGCWESSTRTAMMFFRRAGAE